MKVGVLALQGAFREHRRMLEALGADVVEVRKPSELKDIQAVVIPGGESTAICKLMADYGLVEPLRRMGFSGLPMMGTCAGAIVISSKVRPAGLETLSLMDIEIERNAFGRQVDSFEQDLRLDFQEIPPFKGVFIRAPRITAVGNDVEVLGVLSGADGDEPVAVRQGNVVALTFHPELTADLRLHEYFLKLARDHSQRAKAGSEKRYKAKLEV